MQLNLPIIEQLADRQNILIAGAGGGNDIYACLPLYFTLKALGKTVHLANYSFVEFGLASVVCDPVELIKDELIGVCGKLKMPLSYFPEGYLAQWFHEVRSEEVTIWMFAKTGVLPLVDAYHTLVAHLGIDALILVDGGVDSIMRGNEVGAGTLLEDTVSLAAASTLTDIPVKLLACIGFGTEVEEEVSHHNALENMAALMKLGGFYGACALTPEMEAFQLYEAANRYLWDQPNQQKSHIHTRVVPAVRGEFGDYHEFPDDRRYRVFISPLTSLYWFFDAQKVIEQNTLIKEIEDTITLREAFGIVGSLLKFKTLRPRKSIPLT
jgi:hypothetical protein